MTVSDLMNCTMIQLIKPIAFADVLVLDMMLMSHTAQ